VQEEIKKYAKLSADNIRKWPQKGVVQQLISTSKEGYKLCRPWESKEVFSDMGRMESGFEKDIKSYGRQ
jgi:hypothetical protein